MVHDRNLITDREALLLVMGDVDRGEAELLLQLTDLNTHLHTELRVEVTERLVEEHEIRLDNHRTGEGYTLTLSAGHLLRQALLEAVERQQPPRARGGRPKPRFAHQGGSNPPVIVVHGNALEDIGESYRRYLESFFREKFDLAGTPLRIEFRTKDNPFVKDDKR